MAIFNSKLLNNYKPQGHHLARETPGQFGLVVVVVPLAPQRLRRRQRQGPVFVAFGKPWKVGNAVGWFYGKNHGDNLSQYGMWDPYNYRVFYGSNHGRNPIISIRCDNIWYMIYDIHIYIRRFPAMGVPLNHPFIDGSSTINHPHWGTPIYGTYIKPLQL